MGVLKNTIRWATAIAAGVSLSACLISETPLLGAKNGRATPFAAGDYLACQVEAEQSEPDCKGTAVSFDDTGLYSFKVDEEEEATLIRFRKVGRAGWLAQFGGGEEDDGFFYFVARVKGDGFTLTMITCEDIPKSIRDKYAARGEMEVDDTASVCTATSLRAVMASAKAFLGPNAPDPKSQIIYTKAAAGE
ncbi:MAG: hypothetical protein WD076_02905 [Parvularculaceae bacterium]